MGDITEVTLQRVNDHGVTAGLVTLTVRYRFSIRDDGPYTGIRQWTSTHYQIQTRDRRPREVPAWTQVSSSISFEAGRLYIRLRWLSTSSFQEQLRAIAESAFKTV